MDAKVARYFILFLVFGPDLLISCPIMDKRDDVLIW